MQGNLYNGAGIVFLLFQIRQTDKLQNTGSPLDEFDQNVVLKVYYDKYENTQKKKCFFAKMEQHTIANGKN